MRTAMTAKAGARSARAPADATRSKARLVAGMRSPAAGSRRTRMTGVSKRRKSRRVAAQLAAAAGDNRAVGRGGSLVIGAAAAAGVSDVEAVEQADAHHGGQHEEDGEGREHREPRLGDQRRLEGEGEEGGNDQSDQGALGKRHQVQACLLYTSPSPRD